MNIPLEESHKQLFHARIIFQLLTVALYKNLVQLEVYIVMILY